MHWPYFIFVILFGASVGSFLNVVIYRLPLGRSLVLPASHCPHCGTHLAWYDNVPVLGWVMLRGRCRYCRGPIAFQYPLVEALTALLFAMVFLCYYPMWGFAFGGHWQMGGEIGLADTWPVALVHLALVGALIASTKIDAKLYIIPLEIPWFITALAFIVLPLAAVWLPVGTHVFAQPYVPMQIEPFTKVSAAPVWSGAMIGVAGGGMLGLAIAVTLLKLGVLPMSFVMPEDEAGPDPHEADVPRPDLATAKKRWAQWESQRKGEPRRPPRGAMLVLTLSIMAVLAWALLPATPLSMATGTTQPLDLGPMLAVALVWWGLLLHGSAEYAGDEPDRQEEDPESWEMHPHPRREVMKEVLFLALPAAGAAIGWWAWEAFGWFSTGQDVPAPLGIGAGVAAGYLIGAGVVWVVRIAGTLGFGKEAMGLGDVHLMGAVGAVLGGIDAVVAFFLAAFFGIAHTVIVLGATQLVKKRAMPIPYGPHLCGATLIVMLFRDQVSDVIFVVTGLRI